MSAAKRPVPPAGVGLAAPGEGCAAARCRATVALGNPVGLLRGVSDARVRAFGRLGVTTVSDLLLNAPARYIDFTDITPISHLRIGDEATVMGSVHSVRARTARRRMKIVEASIVDSTGVINAIWFNQPWIVDSIAEGSEVVLQGKVEHRYGYLQMTSPRYMEASDDGSRSPAILPIYRQTKGLATGVISKLVAEAVSVASFSLDPIPADLRERRSLMSRSTALGELHFPSSMEQVRLARKRLAYEELLFLQLRWLMLRRAMDEEGGAISHVVDGPLLAAYIEALPYSLTEDQRAALDAILADMAAGRRMNRMLLGDVGTGKTAVAAAALAAVADSGSQGVLLAPTEVLARQYGEKMGPVLDSIGVRWETLTSATPAAERQRIVAGLVAGQVQALFGTHAVLEPDVVFRSMTLAVVDEEHRFGVDQRNALRAKGDCCDYLSMTATPIPRSLALTMYGYLDCSWIRTRPGGDRAIETVLVDKRNRFMAFDEIRDCVARGHQAYLICPLVGEPAENGPADRSLEDEGDDWSPDGPMAEEELELAGSDLKAARAEADYLAAKVFPEMSIGLLCGKMPASEKSEAMDRFRRGETDVLVSTTVVEVGVDVPNATVMVVEDAERFGLSQLHQLRGRVGRGVHPGKMVLLAAARTEGSRKRLEAMCSTQDGFELAELDLALRHEGDVSGSRQHGMPGLRFSNVARDLDLVEISRADAAEILRDDPDLSDPANMLLAWAVGSVRPDGGEDREVSGRCGS